MDASTSAQDPLTPTQEQAFALSEAAILLDRARQADDTTTNLAAALHHNMEVWIALQSLAKGQNVLMDEGVRANLIKLADFVIATTFRHGVEIGAHTLDTLVNINLQISEGLLEGEQHATQPAQVMGAA